MDVQTVFVDEQVADVWCSVPALAAVSFDLLNYPVWLRPVPQFYDVTVAHGGTPQLNGHLMQPRACGADGAGIVLKWMLSLDSAWHVGCSAVLYPQQKAFAVCEMTLLCQDFAAPQLLHSLPQDIVLSWGHAEPVPAVWPAGFASSHGATHRKQVIIAWPQLCSAQQLESVWCLRSGGLVVQ